MRKMISGKIHRATVTGADLNYVGSVTVDADLLEAANILPGESVDIVNVTNGSRLSTYTIPGERGKGEVILNGAAAHHASAGDIVILMAYQWMDDADARENAPAVVFVDHANHIVEIGANPGKVPPNDQGLKSSGV
ncbi:aspartate 1-decarboxylase [Arcanobacterium wilhelmae]|uniref:Aspartate 1-decarboxylase n=1 Tax=Arcanobacterium wilhelmae TaxID=1803177 RepID=A0ABT9NA74_9ACTO|nr:aspartate 1-decarboxylase [Arcanobacterium wilhelmae]MDP9800605.1 aspartate 1-decarboxylase [Arcanobacterium wilhelmae]WFN90013.1 aspartate 1-decarboxylase [Arcanobacterium wilhelmae]